MTTGELLTLRECAEQTGNLKTRRKRVVTGGVAGGKTESFSPAHKGAAALHGWRDHAQATTEPMRITLDAYQAALAAAAKGDGIPHQEAVSKFSRIVAPKPKEDGDAAEPAKGDQ